MCRVNVHNRWETPFINPSAVALHNIDRDFNYNISSRILEKDYYTPQIPDLSQYHF
jgi:hypothetical protein